MSQEKLDCYIIPSEPLPLLMPIECVAEVLTEPQIDSLDDARAKWMHGHVNWRSQRLPVMSYSSLQDDSLDESSKKEPLLVVLNPIPSAARKAYSGLLCFGGVKQISVDASIEVGEIPEAMDRRYVESVVSIEGSEFVIPKLSALGVAFTYF